MSGFARLFEFFGMMNSVADRQMSCKRLILPKTRCHDLLALASTLPWERGRLNHIDANARELRACDSCFVYPDARSAWLFDWLQVAFVGAGAALGVSVGRILEAPQIVRYHCGDFFDWHQDSVDDTGARALTASIQLSAPEDYEGGSLELKSGEHSSHKIGAVTVFRAEDWHRVNPILIGTRVALVAWIDHVDFNSKL